MRDAGSEKSKCKDPKAERRERRVRGGESTRQVSLGRVAKELDFILKGKGKPLKGFKGWVVLDHKLIFIRDFKISLWLLCGEWIAGQEQKLGD